MTDRVEAGKSDAPQDAVEARRGMLKKFGRFALVSAPAVTWLLAVGSKPARAVICSGECAPSSRVFKTPAENLDTVALLASVAALPVGSYAEDFQAAFGVGDGVTISPIDAIGVCLAAIQALSQKIESLEAQLTGAEFLRAA
jgi:hypothetical protein